ncbi:MAG: hypothetical protein GY950_11200 [bacterium]|nr:hypothetical protein [bacterium]
MSKKIIKKLKGKNIHVEIIDGKCILTSGKKGAKVRTWSVKAKKGKKGEKDEYIIIGDGDDEHEIINIKNIGDDDDHTFIIKKGSEKGEYFKMIMHSEYKLDKKQVRKLKEMVETLRKKLPESYEVGLKLKEGTQKVSIGWRLDDADSKEGEKAMKHVKEFEEAFKKVFPDSKGKKSLKKEIVIKTKKKEKEA